MFVKNNQQLRVLGSDVFIGDTVKVTSIRSHYFYGLQGKIVSFIVLPNYKVRYIVEFIDPVNTWNKTNKDFARKALGKIEKTEEKAGDKREKDVE